VLSDALRPSYGIESLRYAFYIVLGFYLVSSMLFVIASRTIKKDWVD